MKGEGAAETETGMEARGGLGGLAEGTDWWTLALMRFSISSMSDWEDGWRGMVSLCDIFTPKDSHPTKFNNNKTHTHTKITALILFFFPSPSFTFPVHVNYYYGIILYYYYYYHLSHFSSFFNGRKCNCAFKKYL